MQTLIDPYELAAPLSVAPPPPPYTIATIATDDLEVDWDQAEEKTGTYDAAPSSRGARIWVSEE